MTGFQSLIKGEDPPVGGPKIDFLNFDLKLATNVEQSFNFIMLQKLFDLVE